MIVKNECGEIIPSIGKYFVAKNSKGEYEIYKKYPFTTTKACLAYNPWCDIGWFDSMVQAFTYLKENINDLL